MAARRLRDSLRAARSAGLQHIDPERQSGLTRKGEPPGFRYYRRNGRRIRASQVLNRIRSLAIPPAWTDVWISPDPHAHLQATGRDARGRKQYRYHPQWRAVRDRSKYDRVLQFADALPRLRRRVSHDLRLRGLPQKKVLATVVRLLEKTLIRVGNDEYSRENGSFGLTTMRNGHAEVSGPAIRFEFRGKGGIEHEIDVRDPRLAQVVAKCQELSGQELFEYVDEQGQVRDVGSADVNEYLRDVTGQDFTAKDFRTWAGTALAADTLRRCEEFRSQAAAKRNVKAAIGKVAARLGNTVAVCRKCYVHPAIIDAYLDRSLAKGIKSRGERGLRDFLARVRLKDSPSANLTAVLKKSLSQSRRSSPAGRTIGSPRRRVAPARANRSPGRRAPKSVRRRRRHPSHA